MSKLSAFFDRKKKPAKAATSVEASEPTDNILGSDDVWQIDPLPEKDPNPAQTSILISKIAVVAPSKRHDNVRSWDAINKTNERDTNDEINDPINANSANSANSITGDSHQTQSDGQVGVTLDGQSEKQEKPETDISESTTTAVSSSSSSSSSSSAAIVGESKKWVPPSLRQLQSGASLGASSSGNYGNYGNFDRKKGRNNVIDFDKDPDLAQAAAFSALQKKKPQNNNNNSSNNNNNNNNHNHNQAFNQANLAAAALKKVNLSQQMETNVDLPDECNILALINFSNDQIQQIAANAAGNRDIYASRKPWAINV